MVTKDITCYATFLPETIRGTVHNDVWLHHRPIKAWHESDNEYLEWSIEPDKDNLIALLNTDILPINLPVNKPTLIKLTLTAELLES